MLKCHANGTRAYSVVNTPPPSDLSHQDWKKGLLPFALSIIKKSSVLIVATNRRRAEKLLDVLLPKRAGGNASARPVYTFNPKPPAGAPDSNEIDRILAKLSRTGINSLTPEEVKVLEELRERMRKQ